MYAESDDANKRVKEPDIYIEYIQNSSKTKPTAKNKRPGRLALNKHDRYSYDLAELAEIYLGWK